MVIQESQVIRAHTYAGTKLKSDSGDVWHTQHWMRSCHSSAGGGLHQLRDQTFAAAAALLRYSLRLNTGSSGLCFSGRVRVNGVELPQVNMETSG